MKTVPGPSAAVLVHGNAGSSRIWGRVRGALPEPVPAADIPGFGTAQRADLPPGEPLPACVGYVDSGARGVGRPVVLVGNGIGSILCGHAALRLGTRVRGVVMTAPVGLDAGHARLAWLSHHRAGAAFLRLAGRTLGRAKFLGDQLADPDADPAAAAILLDALRRARGFHLLARLNRPESLEGLRHLRCPVTVLWGDRDGVLPVTRADEFMTYLPPHARLEIVPGAGHALPLERPDLVARAIAELA